MFKLQEDSSLWFHLYPSIHFLSVLSRSSYGRCVFVVGSEQCVLRLGAEGVSDKSMGDNLNLGLNIADVWGDGESGDVNLIRARCNKTVVVHYGVLWTVFLMVTNSAHFRWCFLVFARHTDLTVYNYVTAST